MSLLVVASTVAESCVTGVERPTAEWWRPPCTEKASTPTDDETSSVLPKEMSVEADPSFMVTEECSQDEVARRGS